MHFRLIDEELVPAEELLLLSFPREVHIGSESAETLSLP
jgi:hypothetical protein